MLCSMILSPLEENAEEYVNGFVQKVANSANFRDSTPHLR